MARLAIIAWTFFCLNGFFPNLCKSSLDDPHDSYGPGPPEILIHPQDQTVVNGGIVSFFCTGVGNPRPRFEWRKNGERVSSVRYTVIEIPDGSSLRIDPVRIGRDNAKYECVAENSVWDAVSLEATLRIQEDADLPSGFPHIAKNPQVTNVAKYGQKSLLLCSASGNPDPTITWLKNMVPVDMNNPRYSILEQDGNVGSLEIIESQPEDEGEYECVAHNVHGTAYSSKVSLYARERKVPPHFSVPPEEAYKVMPGSSLNMMCVAVGSPMPSVKWSKGDIDLASEDQPPIGKNILVLDNIQESANFTCIASSSLGKVEFTTQVIIQDFPSEPASAPNYVLARPLSSTSVVIQWDKPEKPKGLVTGYKVFFTTNLNQPLANWNYQVVGSTLTTINDLQFHTTYTIKVQTLTSIGLGLISAPVQVKTQERVPSPPTNLGGVSISPTSLQLMWTNPSHWEDRIISYELYWNDTIAKKQHHRSIPVKESYSLYDLHPNTLYYIWVAAKEKRGESATSLPLQLKTEQLDAPRQVNVSVLDLTSLQVQWKALLEKDPNGYIRGYHIYVQEVNEQGDLANEPMRYDVANGSAEEFKIEGLQPNTNYSVQVSAYNRNEDGIQSRAKIVSTPGGVPVRPLLSLRASRNTFFAILDVEWTRPIETYGELLAYRISWDEKDGLSRERLVENDVHHRKLEFLELATIYEVRVAGKNHIGYGQDAIQVIKTLGEVTPGSPHNIRHWFQTPTMVAFVWDPPRPQNDVGEIVMYQIQFHKETDYEAKSEYNTTATRIIITGLNENTMFIFQIKAFTAQGGGPYSYLKVIRTPASSAPPPRMMKALATSEDSVVVWWDPVPPKPDVLGYRVFYTSVPKEEDMDKWSHKDVPLTHSAELTNLEPKIVYAIKVAARTPTMVGHLSPTTFVRVLPEKVLMNLRAESTTQSMTLHWKPPLKMDPVKYMISYGATKEYVDSHGITQVFIIPTKVIYVDADILAFTINALTPFTSYHVNVTAVSSDESFRPPAKITITTAMAAPKPMVKPDFYGIVNDDKIQVILPFASEEFGPISHYYLVVVPEEKATKSPDEYTFEELKRGRPPPSNIPYIAAKFVRRSIPSTFNLGDDRNYKGFLNQPLERGTQYRIFVRAVVDTYVKDSLYTSSPFSDILSLPSLEEHGTTASTP